MGGAGREQGLGEEADGEAPSVGKTVMALMVGKGGFLLMLETLNEENERFRAVHCQPQTLQA